MRPHIRELGVLAVFVVVALVIATRPQPGAANGAGANPAEAAAAAIAGNDECVTSFDVMLDTESIRATPDKPGMSPAGVFVGMDSEVAAAFGGKMVGADQSGVWILRGDGAQLTAVRLVGFALPSGRSAWVIAGGVAPGDCQLRRE